MRGTARSSSWRGRAACAWRSDCAKPSWPRRLGCPTAPQHAARGVVFGSARTRRLRLLSARLGTPRGRGWATGRPTTASGARASCLSIQSTAFEHHHPGAVSGCMACRAPFSARRWRVHHCRHCGAAVCAACSAERHSIPKFNLRKPVRCCRAAAWLRSAVLAVPQLTAPGLSGRGGLARHPAALRTRDEPLGHS